MAKNINIHLKTKGGLQTKQQLNEVGQSARKVGNTTEEMGKKAKRGGGGVVGALKKLVGPIGFMAIGAAVVAAGVKVAKFFDDIKTRTDTAVREVQQLRAAYTDLFEALDAFDEKSRKAVTKATNVLLQQTGVTKELGIPIIDAYTRQFKALVGTGQITQEQYDRGLKETLEYGARHGGEATKDLVAIMSGWGMTTPDKQGEFRRMIAAGAQKVGLTDADVIDALGRGMPTIKAMGWSPQQAIETVTTIAAGEVGRKKKSLPATTFQALMAPQLAKIEEYGISEEAAKDPKLLLEQLQEKRADMDQKVFTRMLVDIYGTESAAGVSKLLTAPRRGISETLRRAARPEGIEAERKEEEDRKGTLEARDAKAKARGRLIALELTEAEQYMEDVRDIGKKRQARLRIDEPKRQLYRETITIGEAAEQEYAAYRDWADRLTDEERAEVHRKYSEQGRIMAWEPERYAWYKMTAKEKYEALVRTQPEETSGHTQPESVQPEKETQTELEPSAKLPPTNVPQQQPGVEQEVVPNVTNVTHHYDYGIHYYPRVGDDEFGPRIRPGVMA